MNPRTYDAIRPTTPSKSNTRADAGVRLAVMAFVLGAVFSVGLSLATMTSPDKIVGFLDFAGAWDPSLMFVMGGAVLVFGAAYRLSGRRAGTESVQWTARSQTGINPRLLGGAGLFGLGWGLSGFCPGPAITALATGDSRVLLFVAAMLVGLQLGNLYDARRGHSECA